MTPKMGSDGKPIPPKFTGTFDCAKTIIRERGLAGVTQGLQATIARNFVGVCAYFYFYEAMRMFQAGDKPVTSLNGWQVLLAGGIGGYVLCVCQCVCACGMMRIVQAVHCLLC